MHARGSGLAASGLFICPAKCVVLERVRAHVRAGQLSSAGGETTPAQRRRWAELGQEAGADPKPHLKDPVTALQKKAAPETNETSGQITAGCGRHKAFAVRAAQHSAPGRRSTGNPLSTGAGPLAHLAPALLLRLLLRTRLRACPRCPPLAAIGHWIAWQSHKVLSGTLYIEGGMDTGCL